MKELGNLVQHEGGRVGRQYYAVRPIGMAKDAIFVKWYKETIPESMSKAVFVALHEVQDPASIVKTDKLKLLAYIHTR